MLKVKVVVDKDAGGTEFFSGEVKVLNNAEGNLIVRIEDKTVAVFQKWQYWRKVKENK